MLNPAHQNKIERLFSDLSPGARAGTAKTVAKELNASLLDVEERALAHEILAILARDTVVLVRQVLAEHVKHYADLDPAVAHIIAHDITQVSLPFIELAPALDDTFLLEIIRSGGLAKQLSVARRQRVSAKVTEALVKTNHEKVVSTTLENGGAAFTERIFSHVMTVFPENAEIHTRIIDRAQLPPAIIERMIGAVGASLGRRLIEKHRLPPSETGSLILHSREKALARVLANETRIGEIRDLVVRLAEQGQLTITLLLRLLASGNLTIFKAGLATAAGIPVTNAGMLVDDDGALGLKGLYRRTSFPEPLYVAVRSAVDVVREARRADPSAWRDGLDTRIADRWMDDFSISGEADFDQILIRIEELLLAESHTSA